MSSAEACLMFLIATENMASHSSVYNNKQKLCGREIPERLKLNTVLPWESFVNLYKLNVCCLNCKSCLIMALQTGSLGPPGGSRRSVQHFTEFLNLAFF